MDISPFPPFILLEFNVFLANMGEPKPNKTKYYMRDRVDHTFLKSEVDLYWLFWFYLVLLRLFDSVMFHNKIKPNVTEVQKFSRGFIFASDFFNISREFNFVNWLPVDFSRGFIFTILLL